LRGVLAIFIKLLLGLAGRYGYADDCNFDAAASTARR
jgi:hypothetical protein